MRRVYVVDGGSRSATAMIERVGERVHIVVRDDADAEVARYYSLDEARDLAAALVAAAEECKS